MTYFILWFVPLSNSRSTFMCELLSSWYKIKCTVDVMSIYLQIFQVDDWLSDNHPLLLFYIVKSLLHQITTEHYERWQKISSQHGKNNVSYTVVRIMHNVYVICFSLHKITCCVHKYVDTILAMMELGIFCLYFHIQQYRNKEK